MAILTNLRCLISFDMCVYSYLLYSSYTVSKLMILTLDVFKLASTTSMNGVESHHTQILSHPSHQSIGFKGVQQIIMLLRQTRRPPFFSIVMLVMAIIMQYSLNVQWNHSKQFVSKPYPIFHSCFHRISPFFVMKQPRNLRLFKVYIRLAFQPAKKCVEYPVQKSTTLTGLCQRYCCVLRWPGLTTRARVRGILATLRKPSLSSASALPVGPYYLAISDTKQSVLEKTSSEFNPRYWVAGIPGDLSGYSCVPLPKAAKPS